MLDPGLTVVVPDPGASADDWEQGTCWTDQISSLVVKPTEIYRAGYSTGEKWIEGGWFVVDAVRLSIPEMEGF